MLFDGHYSHLSVSFILKARNFGVHLLCLPPNNTHILQPLDVGVFGPVKSSDCKELQVEDESCQHHEGCIPHFPQLVEELWDCSFTPSQLKAGFKSAGLVPFDPKAIKSDCLFPSLAQPSSNVETLNIEISGHGMLTV